MFGAIRAVDARSHGMAGGEKIRPYHHLCSCSRSSREPLVIEGGQSFTLSRGIEASTRKQARRAARGKGHTPRGRSEGAQQYLAAGSSTRWRSISRRRYLGSGERPFRRAWRRYARLGELVETVSDTQSSSSQIRDAERTRSSPLWDNDLEIRGVDPLSREMPVGR